MTISTEVRKAGPFIGNGSASVFPFAFKVFKAADLIVVRRQDNIGTETTLVLDSDYHVTLNSNQDTTPGGVVTLVAGALASGFALIVSSELPYLQPTDLTNQGGFYPNVITNALDRLTIFCQQLLEITGRTLKLPITAPTNISAEIPLPNPSKLLAWNETGTGLTTISPQSLVTSIAYGTATADLFAGDGVTTTFPLTTNPASVNNLDVSIGGYSQRPVQDGVGDYSWNGGASITFVVPPPAPTVPGDKNVLVRYMQAIPVSDSEALHAQTREALRRGYAEAGFNLVDGSFETGGTLGAAADVLLQESTGVAYGWTGALPKVVAPGFDPVGVVGFELRTDAVLRGELTAHGSTIDEIAALPAALSSTSGAGRVNTSDGGTVQNAIDGLDLLKPSQTAAQVAKTFQSGIRPAISCYGDSTMWGATVGNLGSQDPNNPPVCLATALGFVYGGAAFTVNNRAISGTTLRQMLAGTDGSDSTFLSKITTGVDAATKLIYCNHGINDSQLDGDIDQYREDLIYFVNACRDNNKVPILVTPNPNPQIVLIDETKGKRLRYYVNTMRDVAEKTGCDLVDQYHFFESSYNYFRPDEIVPDGAHLSSDAYRQAGFNLAIPLVCCQTIGEEGDFSTLTNVTYFDNFTESRQLQTQPTCRCGQILTANRPASGNQGFNYPVILSRGQKCISFIGLQWASAANCNAYDQGGALGIYYQQKQFGSQSNIDWDSECKFYSTNGFFAGLHIFGALFDQTTPGLGNGMTFAGIGIPELTTASSTGAIAAADPYTKSVTDAGDTIICRTYVGAGGVYFTDKSGSPVLVARLNAGVFTVDLYQNGSVVQTATYGSGLSAGVFGLAIRINPTSVNVTLDNLTVTLNTTTKLPNLKPYTAFTPYVRVPTFGVQ